MWQGKAASLWAKYYSEDCNRTKPATPEHPNTLTSSQSNLEARYSLGVNGSAGGEAIDSVADGHVTIRRGSRRKVPPLAPDVEILHGANAKQPQQPTPRSTPSPHRPSPQLVIRDKGPALASATLDPNSTPEVTTDPGAAGDDRGKRGGVHSRGPPPLRGRQVPSPSDDEADDYVETTPDKPRTKGGKDKAKQRAYARLGKAAAAATSLDELAGVLDEQLKTMRAYPATPTKECLATLDALLTRLKDHRTLPVADEDHATFSSVVARSVLDPMKSLAAQVEAQQKAIQNLTKSVEAARNAPLAAPAPSPSYAKAARDAPQTPTPKPKQPPLTRTAEERVLVRFVGEPPPLFHLPYVELVSRLNERLASLGLPQIQFAQKQTKGVPGLYVAPENGREGAEILTRRWDEWGPGALPGGRVVPVVMYRFLQVNGVPFASVGSMEEVAREFERRNGELGPVTGTPRLVNPPPSAAKIAAMKEAGRKPPTAGSIVFQLESKERVDMAVAAGRVALGGQAPQVQRAFPHLTVVQCWGCYQYNHIRSRCPEVNTKCGGCGGVSHGAVCAVTPKCLNCGGVHRADNPSCPRRKEISARMRQRADELCAALDESSDSRTPTMTSSLLSPLPSSLALGSFSSRTHTLAPRLPGDA
ncbi:hypothetical protein C8F04DRAFT_1182380 [Mycena alexandri]|uniref:Gag-like protein n=1 Tax=Mycena alexandri TaxID=1745969 RepID=A0AAD6SWR3_9AGAR|nr:hypothetical protein C8F04DRAFT_1182380 [Mycena alexandri]